MITRVPFLAVIGGLVNALVLSPASAGAAQPWLGAVVESAPVGCLFGGCGWGGPMAYSSPYSPYAYGSAYGGSMMPAGNPGCSSCQSQSFYVPSGCSNCGSTVVGDCGCTSGCGAGGCGAGGCGTPGCSDGTVVPGTPATGSPPLNNSNPVPDDNFRTPRNRDTDPARTNTRDVPRDDGWEARPRGSDFTSPRDDRGSTGRGRAAPADRDPMDRDPIDRDPPLIERSRTPAVDGFDELDNAPPARTGTERNPRTRDSDGGMFVPNRRPSTDGPAGANRPDLETGETVPSRQTPAPDTKDLDESGIPKLPGTEARTPQVEMVRALQLDGVSAWGSSVSPTRTTRPTSAADLPTVARTRVRPTRNWSPAATEPKLARN